MTPQQQARQVYDQGFCIFPGIYDAAECRRMNDIMDQHWRQNGSPVMTDFGYNIHPMMPQTPEIAPFLDRPEALDTLGEIFREEPRLMHLGARMSGRSSAERITWHHHYAWDTERIPTRDRIERVLWGIYVDGTNDEAGPLVALPRKYNDPIGEPLGEAPLAWPGEQEVIAPPGSLVIFDTALWHAARRGSSEKIRHLWGCHWQGWSETRSHPEDNAVDVPEVAAYTDASPRLKSVIRRTLAAAI
jgi:hypothetical protein